MRVLTRRGKAFLTLFNKRGEQFVHVRPNVTIINIYF